MKFYNLDKNLDLDYLEISTKLNLAYWIASDLYEYAESNKDNINGTAKQFIIYPNLSMEMLGDAKLLQNNQSIYADQITYQISSND